MKFEFPFLIAISRFFLRDKNRYYVRDPDRKIVYLLTHKIADSDIAEIRDRCKRLSIVKSSSAKDATMVADLESVMTQLTVDVKTDYTRNTTDTDPDLDYFYEVGPGVREGELNVLTGINHVNNEAHPHGGHVYYGRTIRRVDEDLFAYWSCD